MIAQRTCDDFLRLDSFCAGFITAARGPGVTSALDSGRTSAPVSKASQRPHLCGGSAPDECGNQRSAGRKESWRLIARREPRSSAPQTLSMQRITSAIAHSVKQQTANWNQHAAPRARPNICSCLMLCCRTGTRA